MENLLKSVDNILHTCVPSKK